MPTIGIVFPGQGSQTHGMGVDVARTFPASAECFERASRVLDYDLLRLCEHGSEEELRDTRVGQPAIFTVNVALYRAVQTLALRPVVSAGHSFGEYCSLEIAGALAFEDALRLVNERALAMGQAADLAPGAMAAIIGLDQGRVEELCAQASAATKTRVDLANLNGPAQFVISGDAAGVAAAGELGRAAGAKRVVPLSVSGAWHSPLMEPAVARFATHVQAVTMTLPAFTVVGNLEAKPYANVEQMRRCLIASLCGRVRWHEVAEALVAAAPDLIVECGAMPVLAPMMKRLPQITADRVLHVGDAGGVEKLRAVAEQFGAVRGA